MNGPFIILNEIGKGAHAQVNNIRGVFCLRDDG